MRTEAKLISLQSEKTTIQKKFGQHKTFLCVENEFPGELSHSHGRFSRGRAEEWRNGEAGNFQLQLLQSDIRHEERLEGT